MNKDAKRINPSLRPDIDRVKGYIRHSKSEFFGDGYVFKTALKELRQEGYKIQYHRTTGDYTVEERPL